MRRLLSPLVLLAVLLTGALPAASLGGVPDAELSWVEVFAEDGTISWAQVELPQAPVTAREAEVLAGSGVTLMHGDPGAPYRYNLVIVGDGYTVEDHANGVFTAQAQEKIDAVLAEEPFTTYAEMFNIWAVEVVSAETGVDNDPLPGPDVDTALDMEFWCNGIERLLCVNQGKARTAASAIETAVPGVDHDVDHVLVLANSTKYGGAGGTVATSSGANAASSLVTIHELGHSIGGLADEYEYYARAGLDDDSTGDVTVPAPGLSALPGQEPRGPNITAASTPEELEANELKWFRWLGEESPDGGVVGTYEGGGYSPVLIYRATPDSLMHTLGIAKGGNKLNVVGIEDMTAAFHASYQVIDDLGVSEVDGTRMATLDLNPLVGGPYAITWALDGVEQPALAGATEAAIPSGTQTITVTVRDTTDFVRVPELIEDALTETVELTLP